MKENCKRIWKGVSLAILLALFHVSVAQTRVVIKCFPNPVSENSINLQLSKEGRTSGSVEIFNLLGRQVYKKRIDTSIEVLIVPVDDFPKGLYIVKYFDDNNIVAVKTFQKI
jgi:hypothetical protein